MPFIGNQPAEKYSAFTKQDFSTSATTSYTLSQAVANENEIALFINFVRQEPTTAYTASGTSLTLTSATSSSDDMYCVYLGKAVQTVNPPSGSVGSSQVASSIITGQTAETSIATDDLILLSDTSASGALKKMTRANFVSGVGGNNTPAFCAHLGSNQQISAGATTKIQFNVEKYDTDNAYDNSTNYRFTIPSAGKYFFYFNVTFSNMVDDRCVGYFRKNGNSAALGRQESYSNRTGADVGLNGSYSDDFSANDYMEVYVDGGQSDYPARAETVGETFFGGFKLIT